MEKTVKELRLSTEGEAELVHIVFKDGCSVDLKGPRSGLRYVEREDNGTTVYDCEFEGFELA